METSRISSRSHQPTGGRRRKFWRWSDTRELAYRREGYEGGRRTRRNAPSCPSRPSCPSLLNRVVLPLSILAGFVLTLALVFEALVAGHRAGVFLDRTLEALARRRRFFSHRT